MKKFGLKSPWAIILNFNEILILKKNIQHPWLWKLLWVILVGVIPLQILEAHAIHLIIVADTDDPTIGKGCENNLIRIKRQVTSIAKSIDAKLYTKELKGKDCTLGKIKQTIQYLCVEKDDVIFFYFSGHGKNSGINDWPYFLIDGANYQHDLEWIHLRLKMHNPRLVLTFADACNGTQGKTTPFVLYDKADKNEQQIKNLSRLFKTSEGEVLVSAAMPGTSSYYHNELGGYFSIAFFEALFHAERQETLPHWLEIMEESAKFTTFFLHDVGRNQKPIYRVCIEKIGA